MELRVLNYFLAIAREENITKAAQILHVTQPTLSRQMMQLEEELGVKLFVRSNHRVFLSEDGMLLKRRAQELLSLAEKTRRDFIQREEELSGEIVIGSGEFLGTKILTDMLAAFHKKYPLISYQIVSGNGDNIGDYIERGLLDIGFISEPVDIRKYDFLSMPQKEIWGVMVPKDSELAQKGYAEGKDLDGVPLITAARELIQSSIRGWFRAHGSQMNIVATGNLLYNQAMLAESGLGMVLGIKLHSSYGNLTFVPLRPSVEMETAIIWKKDQVFSRAAERFLAFIPQYLESISDDKNQVLDTSLKGDYNKTILKGEPETAANQEAHEKETEE